MPHIHTAPGQHDFTASAYIVRTDRDEPELLLVNHKKYQTYIQPGGHVELNETPWQAVLHEIEEETGYKTTQLKIIQPPDRIASLDSGSVLHPQPILVQTHEAAEGPHYHTDSAFFFTTDSDPINKPGDGESQDLIWVKLPEMKNIADKTPMSLDAYNVFSQVCAHYLDEWDALETTEFQS